jgi:hypothetical protein
MYIKLQGYIFFSYQSSQQKQVDSMDVDFFFFLLFCSVLDNFSIFFIIFVFIFLCCSFLFQVLAKNEKKDIFSCCSF